MKTKIKGVILIVLVTCSSYVFSQDVVNSAGDTLVHISSTGVFSDLSDNTIGEVLSNGEVKNANGQLIGTIANNEIKNSAGTVIASLNSPSNNQIQIKNSSNVVVAVLHSTIAITDTNGAPLINASDPINDLYLLAFYHFFFNN